jgi:hypothetical protein
MPYKISSKYQESLKDVILVVFLAALSVANIV